MTSLGFSQRLRAVISEKEALLGDTPVGADWAVKALHPSDPLTQVRGIPDMSAATSLCNNYQVTFTLSPQVGATGTWSFDATLLPHPINFMAIQSLDSIGSMNYEVLNTQIPGADHFAKAQWLATEAQQWRLAYAGVTICQDGPDLANQGSLVVAQCPVLPFRFGGSATATQTMSLQSILPVEVYTAEDLPSYTASQAMPSAYFDLSKKGAYVPLKLTKTCQVWRSQTDMVGTGLASQITNGVYSFPSAPAYAWPHWGLEASQCSIPPMLKSQTTTTGTGAPKIDMLTFANYFTSPMLNEVFAHISARNLAVTTSFSMFFRFGIEYRVHPTSVLSPQLELAPRYDERALRSYFAISRELKDAYEASYNDLGKLWSVISGAARDVLPVFSKFGPVGQAVGTIGSGVVEMGDAIKARRSKRKRASKKTATSSQKPAPKKKPT
jgi:hypothetical protein